MSQIKFRASYSVLSLWASGNWEMATNAYFKLKKFATPEMIDGRDWHNKWDEHVTKTKTAPIEFGGFKLNNPTAEQKIVVSLDPEWLDLVGKLDCYDMPTVYEWKTGKQSSECYANSKQGGIYAMLATYSKKYVERIEIHHYDQYIKKADMSIVWVTDALLEDVYNWVTTLSSEMHHYFTEQDLYNRFGANLLTKPAENEPEIEGVV